MHSSIQNYPVRKKRRLLKWIAGIFLSLILILAAGLLVLLYGSSPVTSNIDTYVYSLPYQEGASYKVVQGYGGLFSHKNIAALDFSMPEGTPICAAREGVVYSYRDDNEEGGPLPRYRNRANYIMIQHSDGSIGCYWHLQKGGVRIKKGKVAKGEVIGYSGATGFVWKPHLHFSVKRRLNYNKDSFVRTKFITQEGIQLLKRGTSYRRPVQDTSRVGP